ncbi:octopamine receptor in mushroom bodies isoform X2 [Musca autumnalis]|uniref:octopamine receptor in mushroom bodies isoform X2 n=1 Tax=Musca autumnalis TaxID=221902 RepID=UPI003CFA5876
MNETECESLIKSVKWTEPSNLISLAILEFINVLVIGGNLLVIAAVFCSNKLRSVTNFFIVNLAVADLLVGLAVLPFSATWEVFKVWIFGDVWCRIWLAVDVWMCTASILNLCAISLDRYVAVTRPVTYPSIMSTKKAKSLIAGIWVLSFVICFPPLVGWKDQKPMAEPTYTRGNYTLYYATSTTTVANEPSSVRTSSTSASTATSTSSSSSSSSSFSPPAAPPFISTFSSKFLHRKQRHRPMSATTSSHLPPVTTHEWLQAQTSMPASASSSSPLSSMYNSFNPYDPYHAHLVTKKLAKNLNNHNVNAVAATANVVAGYDYAMDGEDTTYDEHKSRTEDSEEYGSFDASGEDSSASFSNANYETYSREHVTEADYGSSTSSSDMTSTSGNSKATKISSTTYDYVDSLPVSSPLPPPPPPPLTPPPPCPWKCELTNDRGYVLYSALGSFYIPMFVMLFFYWRIYRAAVRTTRAINQGFKTTKGCAQESSNRANREEESQLVLRIHRGRPCSTPQRTPLSVHSMSSTLSVNSNNDEMFPLHHHAAGTAGGIHASTIPKRATSMRVPRQRHEKISIKVSFPSSENVLDSNMSINSTPPTYASIVSTTVAAASNVSPLTNGRRSSFKSSLLDIGETTFNVDTATITAESPAASQSSTSPNARPMESHPNRFNMVAKKNDNKKQRGKRSVKFQVKRFKVETKAAKTLAIIVGGFIFCWLPFFTMYLIRAFCEQCIQPTVFSVLFWLGYCNSAINPLIYALFSHEFRIAFKRIVCRCVCTRSGFRASENFQMIAARALMAPATFHKTISGCSDDGDGPDFS